MRQWQGGQSLVILVAFLVALSAAFLYLYNTGNLMIERARLAATADHLAHAVATEQARLLNLNAYMNRAAIANQLAVAQNVSIASWAQYMQPIPTRASILMTPPLTPIGAVVTQSSGAVATAMRPVSEIMGIYVMQNQAANQLLKRQQQLINSIYMAKLKGQIVPRMLSASKMAESGARVRYLATHDRMVDFIRRYSGDSRQRMAPVMMDSRERFTRARVQWNENVGIDKCSRWSPNIPFYELLKRGGTQLVGLDEWKGMDTFSLHTYLGYWKTRKFKWPKWVCEHTEYPIGYGSAVTSRHSNDADIGDGTAFDGSWSVNPNGSSSSAAMLPMWDSRTGKKALSPAVPEFYDLTPSRLSESRGVTSLDVVLQLYKNSADLQTSAGSSAIRMEGRLPSDLALPHKRLSAVSRAEVYFERPQDAYLNKGMYEKASLFNPYWRVRMSALRARDRIAASTD